MAENENTHEETNPSFQSQSTGTPKTMGVGLTKAPNSLYNAFEAFERETRQRKFLIVECEDSISNLKQELAEISFENKTLEIECEKMELEAGACEMKYEKMQKDKTLLNADFDTLSKEMDKVTIMVTKKQVQLKEMALVREQRLQLIAKAYENHIEMYRQNPLIAELMKKKEENKEKEVKLEEKTEQVQVVEEKFQEFQGHLCNQWESFVTKCIEVAQKCADLQNMLNYRDALRRECKNKESTSRMMNKCIKQLDLRHEKRLLESTPNFSSSLTVGALSKKQSSEFTQGNKLGWLKTTQYSGLKHMDQPRFQLARKRLAEYKPLAKRISHLKSPRVTAGSMVTELRSRLKGTVVVNPMPRGKELPTHELNELRLDVDEKVMQTHGTCRKKVNENLQTELNEAESKLNDSCPSDNLVIPDNSFFKQSIFGVQETAENALSRKSTPNSYLNSSQVLSDEAMSKFNYNGYEATEKEDSGHPPDLPDFPFIVSQSWSSFSSHFEG